MRRRGRWRSIRGSMWERVQSVRRLRKRLSRWSSRYSNWKFWTWQSLRMLPKRQQSWKNSILPRSINSNNKSPYSKPNSNNKNSPPANCTINTPPPSTNPQKPPPNSTKSSPPNPPNTKSKKLSMNKRSLSYKCNWSSCSRRMKIMCSIINSRLRS